MWQVAISVSNSTGGGLKTLKHLFSMVSSADCAVTEIILDVRPLLNSVIQYVLGLIPSIKTLN